jgi:hypothetical protein
MAWWSWLLIWGVLGLAFVGMLVWFGFRLFRKVMAVAAELSDLLDKTQLLESQAEELRETIAPAVFDDPAELSAAREQKRADNERRRQIRRESRVLRGKLLVRADARQFLFLVRRG